MKMITAPILGLLAIVGMLPRSCTAKHYRNSLKSEESLEARRSTIAILSSLRKAGEFLTSGDYLLIMQPNCNLVLYHDSTAVWSTGTGGRDYSCSAKLVRGGNLVVYSPEGVSLWESGTGTPGLEHVLVLQKDGNATIYGPRRWGLASDDTGPDQWLVSPEPTNILLPGERLEAGKSLFLGTYKCSMQTDCRFVCTNDTMYVWATNTAGRGSGCYLELDSRGSFIYDSANSPVFQAIAADTPIGSYVFLIQKSPFFFIYGPELWTTYRDRLTSNSTAQFNNRKIVTVKSQ